MAIVGENGEPDRELSEESNEEPEEESRKMGGAALSRWNNTFHGEETKKGGHHIYRMNNLLSIGNETFGDAGKVIDSLEDRSEEKGPSRNIMVIRSTSMMPSMPMCMSFLFPVPAQPTCPALAVLLSDLKSTSIDATPRRGRSEFASAGPKMAPSFGPKNSSPFGFLWQDGIKRGRFRILGAERRDRRR